MVEIDPRLRIAINANDPDCPDRMMKEGNRQIRLRYGLFSRQEGVFVNFLPGTQPENGGGDSSRKTEYESGHLSRTTGANSARPERFPDDPNLIRRIRARINRLQTNG